MARTRVPALIYFQRLLTDFNFLFLLVVFNACFELVGCSVRQAVDLENNEFAEFEDFDSDQEVQAGVKSTSGGGGGGVSGLYSEREAPPVDTGPQPSGHMRAQPKVPGEPLSDEEDYGIVEEESDEFSHVIDQGEFADALDEQKAEPAERTSRPFSTLKIADVPAHLRQWQDYGVELAIMATILVYLVNYIYGKGKNFNMASAWLDSNREYLLQQFLIVGDDGLSQEGSEGVLIKESDNSYAVWCSGRQGCMGMLVQLRLLKRQDLLSVLIDIFKPKLDTINIKMIFTGDEMDPYVFAVGQRRTLTKVAADANDLSVYCTEKNAEKLGLPSDFVVYSEQGELATGLLDSKILNVLTKYSKEIDYIHISDQYVNSKSADAESSSKLPVTSKVVIFNFNVLGKLNASEKDVVALNSLLPVVFYLTDKARRFRLSRGAKQKAEKNRQRVQESFLKVTHAQRQEAAQQRREERARERKERLLAEEDPERQRRLEKQELKRQMKKLQPRMKQLKIKAI